MATDSYLHLHLHLHQRRRNSYFKPEIPGLAPDHPALRQMDTTNHTVCAYPPLARFLAAAMGKPDLHVMPDQSQSESPQLLALTHPLVVERLDRTDARDGRVAADHAVHLHMRQAFDCRQGSYRVLVDHVDLLGGEGYP